MICFDPVPPLMEKCKDKHVRLISVYSVTLLPLGLKSIAAYKKYMHNF